MPRSVSETFSPASSVAAARMTRARGSAEAVQVLGVELEGAGDPVGELRPERRQPPENGDDGAIQAGAAKVEGDGAAELQPIAIDWPGFLGGESELAQPGLARG